MKNSIYGDVPDSWAIVRLGDICEVNPPLPADIRLELSDDVTFVPMSAIDEGVGEIVRPEVRTYREVQRGYTPFINGDVLFAKITPSMENGKAAIADNLENGVGFGSTEFHVLRPGPLILAGWILALLRRDDFRAVAKSRFVGTAGQQRVPSSFLETFPISLPPLPEQQRIVAILRKADELRHLRRRVNQRASDLLPALFYEMFGDPVRSQKGWKRKRLGDVVEITSSLVDPKEAQYSGYFHVGSDNIESRTGHLIGLRKIQEVGSISGKFLFEPTQVLYSKIRPGLVKVATPDFPGLCSADIYPLSFDEDAVTKLFLAQLLRSNHFTSYVLMVSARAQIPKINRDDLLKYHTIIPEIESQRKFEIKANLIRAIENESQQSLERLTSLSQSLLARAFTGKLTAAWREAHTDELQTAADERDRLLELARKPTEEPTGIKLDTANLAKALASFQAVARELTAKPTQPTLPGFPDLATGLTEAVLPAFSQLAEALRPALQLLAEEVNRQLRENLSAFNADVQNQMLKALAPLIEHYRAEQQGYFAELAKKLADLTRLQLDIPYRREEIEERVFAVAGEHDSHVTLKELAGDWRLNHFSRQPIQEAVDMLVVRGRLRPTVLKLETDDPERPYTFLAAYAPVSERDLVIAEEIEL